MYKYNTSYLLFLALVSALGGFLFGYDWVVIGGAKPFYEVYFNISHLPAMQGWLMGSAILGCLFGVLISGSLSDKFGRKPLLIGAAVLFTVSAVFTGLADSITWFIVYRIVGGVGIGIASNLSPMYIAEIAPSHVRGKFVSINQLTVVLGILSAQLLNWLIADTLIAGEDILTSWNGQIGWRYMFWAEAVPAALFFILIFIIPESPRWLASKGKIDQARDVFSKIGEHAYALAMCKETSNTNIPINSSSSSWFTDIKVLRILILGVVIAVFQQWCGINVIFNYAQEIFSAAGYGVSDILFNIVITGVINVVFTFVGMYTVDLVGRRALMLFGAIGLACIYAILGAFYYYQVTGVAVLILVVAAIACYAMTLAPITWVVLSEIFPLRIRGAAMGIATFALWVACFILTYTFPVLNNSLGAYGTFWLYGLMCLLGFVFLWKYLPETKGKSLEEIETQLVKN